MKEETPQEKLKRLTQEFHDNQKGAEVIAFMHDFFHVVTNDPSDLEKLGYDTSLKTNKPFKMGTVTRVGQNGEYKHNLWLMPIKNSPTWQYGLFEHKLNSRGKKFKLKMITIRELKTWMEKDNGDLDALIAESNFAWANATHAFFLKMRDDNSWSLSDLGLNVLDMKKTPKRLQEITRFTEIYRSKPMNTIKLGVYTNKWLQDNYIGYDPSEEVMFDGPAFMRKSKFIKMCFGIEDEETKRRIIGGVHRGNHTWLFRMITPNFMLKGLLHIVEDEDIQSDLVYHESMEKKELFTTNGNYTFVAWEMPTLYEVSVDDQSMINNPWLYTPEHMTATCNNLLADFKDEIELGLMPRWMKVDAIDQEEGGIVNENNELQEWQANYVKWQEAGFSLYDSSNFIHLAYGQLANRMAASLKRGNIWLPMHNAFMAPVITDEALAVLGGQTLPEETNNLVWFDKRFGAVIPGYRFAETAEMHDTWDQDGDMARFIRIKLWCSNDMMLQEAKDGFIIPANLDVPSTPEEAINMVVVIRSPNGPGGYSIEPYHEDYMPFMRVNEAMVQVIDLAEATPSMSSLLSGVTVDDKLNKIIDNTPYSKRTFTRENATDMIKAQCLNPGFGSFANFMMVYACIYGPSYPSFMPATGNDIIDASSQTANLDAFDYIRGNVGDLWDSMVNDLVQRPSVSIDGYIASRMPKTVYERLSQYMYDGPLTELVKTYVQVLKKVQEEKQNTIYLRNRSELIPKLQELIPTLSADVQAVLEEFNTKYMRKLRAYDQAKAEAKSEETQWSSRYFKAWNSVIASDNLSGIIKEMVDEIEQAKSPSKMAVALYRWLTDPKMSYEKVWHEGRGEYVKANAHLRYGLLDRVVFQAGKRGQKCMMDLLIEGLKNLGL